MLDKVQPKGDIDNIEVIDHECVDIKWKSFYWCHQMVSVTTRHTLISQGRYDHQTGEEAEVKYQLLGFVTSIELELDADALLMAFNGDYDHDLNSMIYQQTLCDVDSGTEVTV